MKWPKLLTIAASFTMLTACAEKKTETVRPAASKPAQIRRVAVLPFQGTGGPAVTNELIRQLLGTGLQVSANPQQADAVISGSVRDYRTSTRTLVLLGAVKTNGGSTTNPVVSLGGAHGSSEIPAGATPTSQLVAVGAAIGIAARLSKPDSTVVWSDETTYEGVDMASAMPPAVSLLIRSCRRTVSIADPSGGS